MENKISRICWNAEDWKFPSGSDGKSASPKSFEAKYGYGHEEWLFNKSRVIDGYHYAFLQPLGLKSNRHVNKIYNIFLFTITNDIRDNKIKYFVGEIKNTQCLSKNESKKIHKIYKQKGWLKEMKMEIIRAGANPRLFREVPPESFFNIRFKFEDVIRPNELEKISDKDINITTTRYKLLPKRNDFRIATEMQEYETEGNLRNTERQRRIYYKGESEFDPYHNHIQNAVYTLLRNTYEKTQIERGRVDIKTRTHDGKWHYFEIKTKSPKLSIREALGQIMEYSYWPDLERAEKLIIVSDKEPDSDTRKYLNHIRTKFNIPIFYRFFNIESNTLSNDF